MRIKMTNFKKIKFSEKGVNLPWIAKKCVVIALLLYVNYF